MYMVTREELLKVKPPQDVIAELKQCAVISKLPFETIKNAFYNALTQPFLDVYVNVDDRCRNASKIIIAQLDSKMSAGGAKHTMEFAVIDVTGISTIDVKTEVVDPLTGEKVPGVEQRKIAKIFGIFASADSDGDDDTTPEFPPQIGVATLWGDACETLRYIKTGGSYSLKFSVKNVDGHYELSLNDVAEPEVITLKLAPITEIIKSLGEPFIVSQASYHLGKFQLMHGRVKSGSARLNRKGKMMGYLSVVDPNTTSAALLPTGQKSEMLIMWTNAPEFATRYGPGSECYFIVDLSTSDRFGTSAFGNFIVPIVAIPKSMPSFFATNAPKGTELAADVPETLAGPARTTTTSAMKQEEPKVDTGKVEGFEDVPKRDWHAVATYQNDSQDVKQANTAIPAAAPEAAKIPKPEDMVGW